MHMLRQNNLLNPGADKCIAPHILQRGRQLDMAEVFTSVKQKSSHLRDLIRDLHRMLTEEDPGEMMFLQRAE